MNKKQKKRQRKIGKQILLVDIIQAENTKEAIFCNITTDLLAEWTSVSKKKVREFINSCRKVDRLCMESDVAMEFVLEDKELQKHPASYEYMAGIYSEYGIKFLTDIDKDDISDFCSKASEDYCTAFYAKYGGIVEKQIGSAEVFERAMRYYVRYFVDACESNLSEGYDWDVVVRMTRFKITRKRFEKLKRYFC